MYKKRLLDSLIKEYLEILPAILIEGAKGVGKTESCSRISRTIFQMDKKETKEILVGNPNTILNSEKPVLIDEWQLAPELWNFVRHEVDNNLADGSVIFTGSSIKVNARIHSGSLRIPRVKMSPFTIEERELSEKYISLSDILSDNNLDFNIQTTFTITEYLEEIYKSGFPGIRNKSDKGIKILLDSYIQNIIEHEFIENGFRVIRPQSLYNWMKSYAASIATTTSFSTIINSANSNAETPSKPTAIEYRDALKALHIIDEVQPFLDFGKLHSNLGKTPKHFFLDTALVTTLLDVPLVQLYNYNVPHHIGKLNISFVGQLIESFVYQSLSVYSQINDAKIYHFRTSRGNHEIDFIIKKGTKLLLIEVKASNTVDDKDVKHLNWLENLAKDEYNITKIVLNTGSRPYKRKDDVIVIPIALLGH